MHRAITGIVNDTDRFGAEDCLLSGARLHRLSVTGAGSRFSKKTTGAWFRNKGAGSSFLRNSEFPAQNVSWVNASAILLEDVSMGRLDNKTALITGAKGGLGSFVTKTFLAAGANVVGVSRSVAVSDFPDPRFVALAAELSSRNAA